MAVESSSIHSGNLNRDKMFNEAWWLNYCFCCGRAIGDIGNPYIGSEAKNICIHQTCQMTEVGENWFDGVGVTCCITQQCAFPPKAGSPTCVCFNKTLVAGDSTSGWKPQLFDWTATFEDQWWLVYTFCGGYGFSKIQANDRPLYAIMNKELCIKQAAKLYKPLEGGVWCSGVGTFFCCWEHVQFPPAPGNPGFKCFGFPKKAAGGGNEPKPMQYGK